MDNVNLPGSAWNGETELVTYSSTADPHDEIWVVRADGDGEPRRITSHEREVAYEPSFSPDGNEVVYELHPLDVEDEGRIARRPVEGSDDDTADVEVVISPEDADCRQPNWAPEGDLIVSQCTDDDGESWALWLADPDGDDRRLLDTGRLDATDASFSPDGEWVVFSGGDGERSADLWAVAVDGDDLVELTDDPGYEGAPSWSPDSQRIACEASDRDPDGHRTTIKVLDLEPAGGDVAPLAGTVSVAPPPVSRPAPVKGRMRAWHPSSEWPVSSNVTPSPRTQEWRAQANRGCVAEERRRGQVAIASWLRLTVASTI